MTLASAADNPNGSHHSFDSLSDRRTLPTDHTIHCQPSPDRDTTRFMAPRTNPPPCFDRPRSLDILRSAPFIKRLTRPKSPQSDPGKAPDQCQTLALWTLRQHVTRKLQTDLHVPDSIFLHLPFGLVIDEWLLFLLNLLFPQQLPDII